jgi:hypothetical protein
MIYVKICQHHWNQHKIWIPSTWTSLSFSSVLLSFNSWNLSIRSSYELLLKVLGYEFLPWSLPSLALFLNLFLAYERGPRKYYVRFVVLRTILNKNYDWFPRAKGQYERCTSEIKRICIPTHPACSIVLSSEKFSSCRRRQASASVKRKGGYVLSSPSAKQSRQGSSVHERNETNSIDSIGSSPPRSVPI